MKKFRFAPIHLAMAGLISFIILAICLRLFGDSLAMLAALMLAGSFDCAFYPATESIRAR